MQRLRHAQIDYPIFLKRTIRSVNYEDRQGDMKSLGNDRFNRHVGKDAYFWSESVGRTNVRQNAPIRIIGRSATD